MEIGQLTRTYGIPPDCNSSWRELEAKTKAFSPRNRTIPNKHFYQHGTKPFPTAPVCVIAPQ